MWSDRVSGRTWATLSQGSLSRLLDLKKALIGALSCQVVKSLSPVIYVDIILGLSLPFREMGIITFLPLTLLLSGY